MKANHNFGIINLILLSYLIVHKLSLTELLELTCMVQKGKKSYVYVSENTTLCLRTSYLISSLYAAKMKHIYTANSWHILHEILGL